MNKEKRDYRVTTESFAGSEPDLKSICTAQDLVLDIKYLLKDFYLAAFSTEGEDLIVKLNNGQKFKINVCEY